MSNTRINARRARRLTCIAAVMVLALVPGVAAATCGDGSPAPPAGNEDGVLRVCESALNLYALAVLPLSHSESVSVRILVPNPFGFPPLISIRHNGTAAANVTSLRFDIGPGSVVARASAIGTVFGIPISANLMATVSLTIDPVTENLIVDPGPMSIQPSVQFLPGIRVSLPFPINVESSISIPPIPLDAVLMNIDTVDGEREIHIDVFNQDLTYHEGFLELKGNVRFR